MNFRNPTLLALAQLAPHCMGCRVANVGQVVSAHSNQSRDGKAAAMKASDAAIAFLCDTCHHLVDAGRTVRADALALWEEAHRATMRWLIEAGHLAVSAASAAAIPAPKPKPKAKIKSGRPIQSRSFEKRDTPQKIPPRPFPKRAKP